MKTRRKTFGGKCGKLVLYFYALYVRSSSQLEIELTQLPRFLPRSLVLFLFESSPSPSPPKSLLSDVNVYTDYRTRAGSN